MTTRSFAWFASSLARTLERSDISGWPNRQIPQRHSHSFTGKRRDPPAALPDRANSFRLIHEEAIFVGPGTLEGAMNSDESMMAMGIPCIVP
jgi:hypothetical protein